MAAAERGGNRVVRNYAPIAGHWCDLRHREHYEPCGCKCEPCTSARTPTADPVPNDEARGRVLGADSDIAGSALTAQDET